MTKENKEEIINTKRLIERSRKVQKVLKGLDILESILVLDKLLMSYKHLENEQLKRAELSVMANVLKKKLQEGQLKKDL